MRLLLDTHAFLWWLGGDAALSVRAREAMADAANDVFVSAASAWTHVRVAGASIVSSGRNGSGTFVP